MPARGDFPVAQLKPWLGNLALIDLFINDGAVFRLCGTNLLKRFEGERKGQRVAKLSPEVGRSLRFSIHRVVHTRQPFITVHDGIVDFQYRQFLELCMPLTDGGLHIGTLMFASYPIHRPVALSPTMDLVNWESGTPPAQRATPTAS
jgi:hypothetical protein